MGKGRSSNTKVCSIVQAFDGSLDCHAHDVYPTADVASCYYVTPATFPRKSQIASVMSMLLLAVRRTRMIWPAPVTNPAPRSTAMRHQGLA